MIVVGQFFIQSIDEEVPELQKAVRTLSMDMQIAPEQTKVVQAQRKRSVNIIINFNFLHIIYFLFRLSNIVEENIQRV